MHQESAEQDDRWDVVGVLGGDECALDEKEQYQAAHEDLEPSSPQKTHRCFSLPLGSTLDLHAPRLSLQPSAVARRTRRRDCGLGQRVGAWGRRWQRAVWGARS